MTIKKNSKYLYHKLAITLFFTFLTSCGIVAEIADRNTSPQGNQNEIRIVDLDGNARQVKRYVPEFNARIIAKRNLEQGNPQDSAYSEQVAVPNINSIDSNKNTSGTEQPKVESAQVSNAKKPAEIEYDLSSSNIQPAPESVTPPVITKPNPSPTTKPTPAVKSKKKDFKVIGDKSNKKESETWKTFVQIGSYSSLESAKSVLDKGKAKEFSGEIQESKIKDKKIYRVLLGPFDNHRKANDSLKKVIKSGHKDAFIVKSK